MSHLPLVKELYAAFGRGDVPGVLAMFAPDIEWSEAQGNPYQPGGQAWVGPDSVLQNLFMRMGEDWDGFTAQTQSFHDANGTVVVEGRYLARHKRSGKSLDSQFCHVWKIRGGKLVSFQQYTDTAQWQVVMDARS